MSLITTPFSDLEIDLGAPYRLGYPEHEQPSRRMYPNFTTDYMQRSDMLIIFTHSYHLKMLKDVITTEIGRSLFATVHGIRYIEWTLHIRKEQRDFSIELVRETDTNIRGEFRVQFRAQSKTSRRIECFPAHWHELKHRVEYIPHYMEELSELYQNDEFHLGQLKIEIRLAFALDDFNYIVPEINLNPLLNLEPESTTDKRLEAMIFVNEMTKSMFYIRCSDEIVSYDKYCLYITCRYFHDYIDNNPDENSIDLLEFESDAIEQVLSFAFTGICQVKYHGGNLNSSDFANYHQFIACLNLLKPLMYRELLQMHDEDCCRIFQKQCNATRPPCEINTLQFLRFAIRWGFPKFEACTIARLVAVFPDTYHLHLNVAEQPHIIDEIIQARINYEMNVERDNLADPMVSEISPLERIELLKAKCKQVFKWIGQGLMSNIPEPSPLPTLLPERNPFKISPAPQSLYTYDAMEESD